MPLAILDNGPSGAASKGIMMSFNKYSMNIEAFHYHIHTISW